MKRMMTGTQDDMQSTIRLPADVARALHNQQITSWKRFIGCGTDYIIDNLGRLVGRSSVLYRTARWVGRQIATAYPPITVFEPPLPSIAEGKSANRLLLVSHDLTRSGAPRIVLEIAHLALAKNYQVFVLSGADGPFCAELVDAGVTVIIDPAIMNPGAPLPVAIADLFGLVICNTSATSNCAEILTPLVPTVIYTHEVSSLADTLIQSRRLRRTLAQVAEVWAGSELSANLVRPIRQDVAVIPYGLDIIVSKDLVRYRLGSKYPLILSVFASYEPRKGQDILVAALSLLPIDLRSIIRVRMFGRVLDTGYYERLISQAKAYPEITIAGPLDEAQYDAALLESDVVVVPSRSDTLPLVSLDALGAGRILLCTRDTGTSAYIDQGVSGFVAEAATSESLASVLEVALQRRSEWPTIAAAGHTAFTRHFSRSRFWETIGSRIDALAAECPHS